MTRNALGRGLGALIREPEPQIQPQVSPGQLDQAQATTSSGAAVAPARDDNRTLQIDIDLIEPSPHQPRTTFREAALEEVAAFDDVDEFHRARLAARGDTSGA